MAAAEQRAAAGRARIDALMKRRTVSAAEQQGRAVQDIEAYVNALRGLNSRRGGGGGARIRAARDAAYAVALDDLSRSISVITTFGLTDSWSAEWAAEQAPTAAQRLLQPLRRVLDPSGAAADDVFKLQRQVDRDERAARCLRLLLAGY